MKVLLEDYGGGKIKKKELADAVLQIKSAMENRLEWKKTVKSICSLMTPLPYWNEHSSINL